MKEKIVKGCVVIAVAAATTGWAFNAFNVARDTSDAWMMFLR